MKTDDVYFAQSYITTDGVHFTQRYINIDKNVQTFQCGNRVIYYKPLREVLVLCKENKSRRCIGIDLNTGEKYSWDINIPGVGKIFIFDRYESFNLVTGNTKKRLSKRKILKMGNQVINEIKEKKK